MSEAGWPGDWHSKETKPKEPGFTNDHGILYMIGDSAEEYLQMEDRPEHLENKC